MNPFTEQNSNVGIVSRSGVLIKAVKILAAAFVLISAFIWKIPVAARTYGYWTVREALKTYTVVCTVGMEKLTSDHFYVKFRPANRADARLVLEAAEFFYRPVVEDFGYTPRGRVPIIMHSSREELNRSFGWEANESAIGVYYSGVIRALAPQSWIDDQDPENVKEIFLTAGPMAHEYTHLMIDYLTGGNYPRWFTEGMAQYEEYKLTGFRLSEQTGAVGGNGCYTMKEMAENFDGLSNQPLAYKEALAAIEYIADEYGEKTLHSLIGALSNGMTFENALQKYLGLDYNGLEKCRRG